MSKKDQDFAARLIKEYDEANQTLQDRITDKQFGFDTYDKLYNVYLDPNKWPYSAKLATPRSFTGIYNKTTRMVGGRFTGRVEGVEMGDDVGANIGTQHFKYSVDRFNQYSLGKPIESIIAQWDTNTRTYGAGFVRAFWKTEYKKAWDNKKKKYVKKMVYNNWWLESINNRDLLLQPGRATIQESDYVILRRYASLEQLEMLQEDGAGFDDEAMNELKRAKTGHGKDPNYEPAVKFIKNQSYTDDRFEYCITYHKDKWVTWVPKVGRGGKKSALILRKKDHPYLHGIVPIVTLVYIPMEEDIYGMSEYQPVRALLKILSALQSQFIELVNKELYPPTLVNVSEARRDTFKYRPKAFWLVNNPSNVTVLDQKSSQSLSIFSETYKMLVTEFLEAIGETGAGVSQVDLLGGSKTATEVRDKAFLRGARDNFNKLMMTAALKQLMYLIFEMLRDPRYTDKNTVIKVVGRDALEYFDKQGFSSWNITDEGYDLVYDVAQQLSANPDMVRGAEDNAVDIYDLAYDLLMADGTLDQFAEPVTPTVTAEGVKSKLQLGSNESENVGFLYVNPEDDYLGQYNFIPDVEALGMPDPGKEYQEVLQWYNLARETEQTGSLQREGYTIKHKDLLAKLGELGNVKEADQYFEKLENSMGVVNETQQSGAGIEGAGSGGQNLQAEQVIPGTPVPPIQ